MRLRDYKAKRDFSQTAEPRGRRERHQIRSHPLFVVQKHAARRLHYDFRLEMDGVLKSWAVPKGIPLVQGAKNLAVQVEDHPLEYGGFEGTIPTGNYGAGTVMVWDYGGYEVEEGTPTNAMRKGLLRLTLHGRKLRGHWVLSRMRSHEDNGKHLWLLIKTGENSRRISVRADKTSILSGQTCAQLGTGRSGPAKRRARTTQAASKNFAAATRKNAQERKTS